MFDELADFQTVELDYVAGGQGGVWVVDQVVDVVAVVLVNEMALVVRISAFS